MKHKKVTKEQIDSFFKTKKLAIAGVSRNEKKFGNFIFKELQKKNFEVFPINPNAEKIDGQKCYSNVKSLPENIESILIATPKKQTDNILKEAINKGIKNIWVQQMSESDRTINIAQEYNMDIICHKCVLMFAVPVQGMHKFHRAIMKLFGYLPK